MAMMPCTLYLVACHCRRPADNAACRMGHEHAATGFGEELAHAVCNHANVEAAGVRRHHAEELCLRRRVFGEGDAVVHVGVDADAELRVPELVIRCRAQFDGDGALSRLPASWLINEIDGVVFAQKEFVEARSAIRRGHPAARRLAVAVQEDKRRFFGVDRDLVEDAGVVAVQGHAAGGHSGFMRVPECPAAALGNAFGNRGVAARRGFDGAANGKAALFGKGERRGGGLGSEADSGNGGEEGGFGLHGFSLLRNSGSGRVNAAISRRDGL